MQALDLAPQQEANFYRITLSEENNRNGIMIIARSPSYSKFKVILFDREGSVRKIEVRSLLFRARHTTLRSSLFPGEQEVKVLHVRRAALCTIRSRQLF